MAEKKRGKSWTELIVERPPNWERVDEITDQLRAELDLCALDDQEAAPAEARTNATFTTHGGPHGPFFVPDRLWRLELQDAFAVLVLPQHIEWPAERRIIDLTDRVQRARAYEAILTSGDEGDLWRFIDGALLVDLWDELPLPTVIRKAWAPLIIEARLWA